MTRGADRSDSFISMVLSLNGRVRPADLHSIPEAERAEALAAYLTRHEGETALHMAGDELVAGAAAPASAATAVVDWPGAATASAAAAVITAAPGSVSPLVAETPAGLVADDFDLLLGDYEGQSDREVAAAPDAEPDAQPKGARNGAATAPAAASRAVPDPTRTTPSAPGRPSSRRWLLWWVPTLLLPLLGGAAAWFALRKTRIQAARAMLAVGIAIGMVASVLFLRYAEPIAVSLNTNTKITLPSTRAKPDPADAGQTPGSGTNSPGGSSQKE